MATSSLLGSPNWALHPGISLLCVSDISQRFPERPSSLQIGFTLLKISWEVEPHAFFSYSMTAGHHFGKHAGDPHCKRSQATEALHFSYRKGKVWVLLFQPITPIGPLYNHFSTSLSIGSIFPKAIRKISLHFPFLFPFCSSLSTGGEMKQRAGGERAICLYFLCIFPYPFSFLCWPSVQIPAPPPLKKKTTKKLSFFSFLLTKQSLSIKESHVSSLLSVDCQQSQEIIWKPLHKLTRQPDSTCMKALKEFKLVTWITTSFFLKVRFILTQLYKTKRPRMSHLYSYPRQTTENISYIQRLSSLPITENT